MTGGGSRAYAETYGPRDASASSVQILLDEGVIISGKTKTSQFAHGCTSDYVFLFASVAYSAALSYSRVSLQPPRRSAFTI